MDADDAGVAHLNQIARDELAKRDALLFLRVVDPNHLSKALAGLYSGCMGIVVALKVEPVKTMTLANNLGHHFQTLTRKAIAPTITAASPAEFHKWIAPALMYSCKLL